MDSPTRPLRMLSLGRLRLLATIKKTIVTNILHPDGGGVRGLSSIMILKHIMGQINDGRSGSEKLEPWQVFDLIGGTSTGG